MRYRIKPKEKLTCRNILCAYWRDEYCTLDGISVDSLGVCQECTFLEFDRETIENTRQKTLARFEQEEAELEARGKWSHRP